MALSLITGILYRRVHAMPGDGAYSRLINLAGFPA